MSDLKSKKSVLPCLVLGHDHAATIGVNSMQSATIVISGKDLDRLLRLIDTDNAKRDYNKKFYHGAVPHASERKQRTEPIKLIVVNVVNKAAE